MKINNQSDFKIKEVTKNEDFNVRFRFEFFVYEFKKYVVSWDGKEYVNCKRLDDGSLEIIFNNPKFGLGQLKVRREYYISDEDFIDGIWNAVTVEKTGIYITDGETDDIDVENVIVPPYIKGEPGKDMKWSTMTQDEKDELINDLGEGINNSFVEAETTRNNNEELRKTSESARVTAEQGRVEAELKRGTDFDTLKSEMQTAIDEGKAATKETIAATEGLDSVVEGQNAKITELSSEVTKISTDVFSQLVHIEGTARVSINIPSEILSNVTSVLILANGSIANTGLIVTCEDGSKEYPQLENTHGYSYKFIEFTKKVISLVAYSNTESTDAVFRLIPNTNPEYTAFKNQLISGRKIISSNIKYLNVIPIFKKITLSKEANFNIERISKTNFIFKINNKTKYLDIEGDGDYECEFEGVVVKASLSFSFDIAETPELLNFTVDNYVIEPIKVKLEDIVSYNVVSQKELTNKLIKRLYIKPINNSYSDDESYIVRAVYKNYGGELLCGISIKTVSDGAIHYFNVQGVERNGIFVYNQNKDKFLVYYELDLSALEGNYINKILDTPLNESVKVLPYPFNENFINNLNLDNNSVDINTSFLDAFNSAKNKQYDNSWESNINLEEFDTINITSQDEFENLSNLIVENLPNKNLIVNFNQGLYKYKENHIDIPNSNYSLVLNGNGASVISDGQEFLSRDAIQYNTSYHVHLHESGFVPYKSYLDLSNNKVEFVDIMSFENFRTFASKALAVSENSKYNYKIPIQQYEEELTEDECSDLYIVTTTGWKTIISPVTKIATDGNVKYAYIVWSGDDDVKINMDYDNYNSVARYKFINKPGHPVYIKSGHIYISNCYDKLCISDNNSFIKLEGKKINSLSINRFNIFGGYRVSNRGTIQLSYSTASRVDIVGNTFNYTQGDTIFGSNTGNVNIYQNKFIRCGNRGIRLNKFVNAAIKENLFEGFGHNLIQSVGIDAECDNYIISHNRFINMNHGCIASGFWYGSGSQEGRINSGIIEYNDIVETDDFSNNYANSSLMDLGKIYISSYTNDVVVRYNRIYVGRNYGEGGNGIYLDGGCKNTKIIGNLVINPTAGKSLYQRWWGELYTGCNENNAWIYNLVFNDVFIEGSEVNSGSSTLGKNFIFYKQYKPSSHKQYGLIEDDSFVEYICNKGMIIKVPKTAYDKLMKIDLPINIKSCISD